VKNRQSIDSKMFKRILRSVTLELLAFTIYGALAGAVLAFFMNKSYVFPCCVGGIVGVMIAILTVYRRLRLYWYD